MEITLEEMQKKFDELPEDLRWAIMGAQVDDKIIDIGHEQGLNVAQTGQLSLETNMVMFGFTHPDKFEESIKASLGLPSEKIKTIIDLVNEKILKNIREQLMTLQGTEKTTEENKDTDILKSAQIEITDGKPITQNENITASREEMLSRVENPDLINLKADTKKIESIAAQKLAGSFQIPSVKTDHSLPSLSKDIATPMPSSKLKADPYREIPE